MLSESVCAFSCVLIHGMMSFSRHLPAAVTRSVRDARHVGGSRAARDRGRLITEPHNCIGKNTEQAGICLLRSEIVFFSLFPYCS